MPGKEIGDRLTGRNIINLTGDYVWHSNKRHSTALSTLTHLHNKVSGLNMLKFPFREVNPIRIDVSPPLAIEPEVGLWLGKYLLQQESVHMFVMFTYICARGRDLPTGAPLAQ